MFRRRLPGCGEARRARRRGSPLQVFWLYSEVASLGDVVIRKRRISTVATRVSAVATTLSPYCGEDLTTQRDIQVAFRTHIYKNQISLGARRQEARRSLPPDLYRIESASSR
jgi:hypothetical protein